MPARLLTIALFAGLAISQAIVSHMRSWNKGPTVTYSTEPVQGNKVHGKQLFAHNTVLPVTARPERVAAVPA